MEDPSNGSYEYSETWRPNIDDIDERGLLSCDPNQMKADPTDDEDDVGDCEADDIYIGRTTHIMHMR